MRIVIVDDDRLVTSSLKAIISAQGIEVLAVGNSCSEAVSLYQKFMPDILLTDIRMGEETGIEAAKQILAKYPDAKILFLTTFSDEEYIFTALRIGAKGYILKQNYESIVPALNAVWQGQVVFGSEIVSKFTSLPQDNSKKDVACKLSSYNLSEKEVEIIEKVAKGLSNKEIASELFLGEGTVRNYLSIILEKLNLRDRTQLAIFYLRGIENS